MTPTAYSQHLYNAPHDLAHSYGVERWGSLCWSTPKYDALYRALTAWMNSRLLAEECYE